MNSKGFSNFKRLLFLLVFVLAHVSFNGLAADQEAYNSASASSLDKEVTDVEWFRDAKFGMFIHWGLYSVSGGVWDGEKYYGITEWLMRRGKIKSADYKTLADEFNPTEFDAEEWVEVARDAGVRYIVIVAKHHDGFALFESEASDFNVVDSTPFNRDPLKELAAAAQKAGIKFGFYYSQYQDWTERHAGGNDWEFDNEGRDLQKYLQSKALPQLEELLTNYGPIDIIWFDTPGDFPKEDAVALKAWVKRFQPNILVSDRIGYDLGDFKGYRDGEIPAVPEPGRPWEAIFTHNDSWGYSRFDTNFKSTSEVLDLLLDTASKGGNFMLNVGPDGSGRIPDDSVYTFRQIGAWLAVNGESIYGTEASPLGPMPWGKITSRPGKLYLHVLDRPENGSMIVPNLEVSISKVSFLASGDELTWEQKGKDTFIVLPDKLPDSRDTVVVVDYYGSISPDAAGSEVIVSRQYGPIQLDAARSAGNGDSTLKKFHAMHYFGNMKHYTTVAGLTSPEKKAVWKLRVIEPGAYKIIFSYAASSEQAGQEGVMELAGKDYYFKVLETGELLETGKFSHKKPMLFIEHPIAVVHFDKPGSYELVLRADQKGVELMKLRHITIQPQD